MNDFRLLIGNYFVFLIMNRGILRIPLRFRVINEKESLLVNLRISYQTSVTSKQTKIKRSFSEDALEILCWRNV